MKKTLTAIALLFLSISADCKAAQVVSVEVINRYDRLLNGGVCEHMYADKINEKEKELSYKQFYERICSNHKKRAEQDKEKQSVDKEIFSTERDLNSCFDNIEKNIGQIIEHRREIFTDEFINKSDMNSSADVSINADDVKQFVSSKLVELYGRDEDVIDKTLDELKNHPEEESCIDKIFPQNKLADFRMYYGNIGKADSEEFVKYRDDIAEYIRGIDQLLHNK